MKLSSTQLIVSFFMVGDSSAFVPVSHPNRWQIEYVRHVRTALHQTDPERKRDKVRSLIVNTANKAASLSKSVLNKGGAPIASILKEAATEGGGIASEKLIEVLNRIEGTLDRVEEEVNSLRADLKGVRASLRSYVVDSANDSETSRENTITHDVPAIEISDAPVVESTTTIVETIEEQNEISTIDLSSLKYEDIDYNMSEMAPPFISEDECLVPGEPLVRVEKAPQNSRRIFAGIDIPVSVDDVWSLLTNYENLQKVVPNLVVNEVLQLFPGTDDPEPIVFIQSELSDAEQCREIANRMKGAVLRQVGGAKVVGINFSARTTLEVREWPNGMPDFAHYEDEVYEGKSRSDRAKESTTRELTRYVFPRPFALSSLPHKDISMQSIENDDGEFRMYQGVWRMQPLPGCSPPGESAMRLTYAVEVSPRPYLPVALVERRIAADLCNNLKAIREHLAGSA